MKKLLLLLSTVFIISCAQQVEPTTENINSIFQSKDFTIEFISENDHIESMSFIEDIIIYKSLTGVQRRTISYDEALLINDFIQKQFSFHEDDNQEIPSIIILNTAKKVTLKIPNYEAAYSDLILKLEL